MIIGNSRLSDHCTCRLVLQLFVGGEACRLTKLAGDGLLQLHSADDNAFTWVILIKDYKAVADWVLKPARASFSWVSPLRLQCHEQGAAVNWAARHRNVGRLKL